jgi:hypothetical protein
MENSVAAAPALSSLSFILHQESGELIARFEPTDGDSPPDMAVLTRLLGEQGFDGLLLPEQTLHDFISRCEKLGIAFEMPIGKRCDGEFTITLADDLQSADLTLKAPHGGRAVEADAVLASLHAHGIIYGVQQAALDAALAAGHCEHLCIAKGDAPVQGTPGRFESMLVDPAQQLADADAHEDINYNDLCHLLLVHSGQLLMRRIAPIPGINGTNIKGAAIAANPIPDIAFASPLEGAAPDPDNPDLLVATQAGQPVVMPNGIYVNNVLEVANLDLNTGNIAFEGTIRIQGDVKAGMQLKVSGDVIVNGTVEAAEIIAGGNVTVNGGIIGFGNPQPGAKTLPANTARIQCQGSVQALFMEHARIEAGDSILIASHARRSELFARNAVLVGKPGAKNSHIAGGTVQATQLVKVPTLGAASGMQTSVHVGSDPYLVQEIAAHEQRLQDKLSQVEKMRQLLAYLKQNPQKAAGGAGEKVQAAFKQLSEEIYQLVEEKAEMAAKQKLTEQSKIEVSYAMYEGVELRIGKQVLSIHENRSGGTVSLVEGVIAFN